MSRSNVRLITYITLMIHLKLLRPHSITLASCKPGCKLGFQPGLQPGFRQLRVGLRYAFDTLSTRFRLFCRKPSREPAASISTCGRHYVLSKFAAGFRLAFDMLSTCLRRAFDTLTQVESQVCSQVCSLLE